MEDSTPAPLHFRLPRFTEENFAPYALAMGQANLAWNDLHEHMGRLFAVVLTTVGNSRSQGLAVWAALSSDRAKRQCLLAAAKDLPTLPPWPRLQMDVEFLCHKGTSLEDARNNIIHGPLILQIPLEAFSDRPSRKVARSRSAVVPHTLGGNQRAGKLAKKNLTGKELLAEYRRVRVASIKLRDFAAAMDDALNERRSWPKRPTGLGG